VGRGIAHGLDEERLRRQIQEIRQLNERSVGLYIFAGIEVDIRADGSLDLPDELLGELDIVIAAVHSAMGQDQVNMTERILRALENPNVDVLAHPSCRLLGEREPVAADWDAVFRTAARTNTLLEINAIPQRLDLRDFHVVRAMELGVEFVVDTDSHSPGQLGLIKFGVAVARRGWCEAKHIFNTRPLEEVKGFLRRAER
jgi:DNA polymerase (family 10)